MPPLRHRALARLAFVSALAAGLSLPLALPLAAQEPAKRLDVRCIVTPPPRIDGLIDDACWQAVAPVSGFYQYDPVNGAKASEETFVWAAFDQDTLYFAFLMKDSRPEKIWAELTPRNEWDQNDAIELILDAYNDKRTSITFAVNPRGVQKNSVETIWKSEAVIRPDGWSAEMASRSSRSASRPRSSRSGASTSSATSIASTRRIIGRTSTATCRACSSRASSAA
ncbi:MAG: hypothetical protein H6P96_970 [Candidatus Aminicenantes bacterium]|nr:hypothetical protein [Candidatus Aminicenantes bacterium]